MVIYLSVFHSVDLQGLKLKKTVQPNLSAKSVQVGFGPLRGGNRAGVVKASPITLSNRGRFDVGGPLLMVSTARRPFFWQTGPWA